MRVKIRHIEAAESVSFGEARNEDELQELIRFIKRSGGVYIPGKDTFPFHSYQLVLGDGEFFVELLLGDDGED